MKKTKTWKAYHSMNAWEYSGTVTITADHVKKIDNQTLLADGVVIHFDEPVDEPVQDQLGRQSEGEK